MVQLRFEPGSWAFAMERIDELLAIRLRRGFFPEEQVEYEQLCDLERDLNAPKEVRVS